MANLDISTSISEKAGYCEYILTGGCEHLLAGKDCICSGHEAHGLICFWQGISSSGESNDGRRHRNSRSGDGTDKSMYRHGLDTILMRYRQRES